LALSAGCLILFENTSIPIADLRLQIADYPNPNLNSAIATLQFA